MDRAQTPSDLADACRISSSSSDSHLTAIFACLRDSKRSVRRNKTVRKSLRTLFAPNAARAARRAFRERSSSRNGERNAPWGWIASESCSRRAWRDCGRQTIVRQAARAVNRRAHAPALRSDLALGHVEVASYDEDLSSGISSVPDDTKTRLTSLHGSSPCALTAFSSSASPSSDSVSYSESPSSSFAELVPPRCVERCQLCTSAGSANATHCVSECRAQTDVLGERARERVSARLVATRVRL